MLYIYIYIYYIIYIYIYIIYIVYTHKGRSWPPCSGSFATGTPRSTRASPTRPRRSRPSASSSWSCSGAPKKGTPKSGGNHLSDTTHLTYVFFKRGETVCLDIGTCGNVREREAACPATRALGVGAVRRGAGEARAGCRGSPMEQEHPTPTPEIC